MQAYANARKAEHEVSLSNAWPSYYSNSYLNTARQYSGVAIAKAMWYEYFPWYLILLLRRLELFLCL